MSKNKQIDKNFKLTAKLAEYIADNPSVAKNIPSGYSFIPFSASDKELNKLNLKLLEELHSRGKKVVKAEETKDTKSPWKLTLISS